MRLQKSGTIWAHLEIGKIDLLLTVSYMAEGEGFEPPVPFRVQRFSRPPVSTAHTSLRSLIYRVSQSLAKTQGHAKGRTFHIQHARDDDAELNPEQRDEAESSKGNEQAEARDARLPIGKGVSIDSLDEIVAGCGNQDSFCT